MVVWLRLLFTASILCNYVLFKPFLLINIQWCCVIHKNCLWHYRTLGWYKHESICLSCLNLAVLSIPLVFFPNQNNTLACMDWELESLSSAYMFYAGWRTGTGHYNFALQWLQVFETLLQSFQMTVLNAYKSKFAQVNLSIHSSFVNVFPFGALPLFFVVAHSFNDYTAILYVDICWLQI